MLPSLALDSGIHARMTALKIITSNNAYLLWLINTFTVSPACAAVTSKPRPATWLRQAEESC